MSGLCRQFQGLLRFRCSRLSNSYGHAALFSVSSRLSTTPGLGDDKPDDALIEDDASSKSLLQDDAEDFSTDPKDRTRVIPVELSMRYLESASYQETYGDKKVWELYRRNFAKGRTFTPTRRTCVRAGKISTGNPCPICRDEYLVIDYRNLKLLNQFLTEYNAQLVPSSKSGLCQKEQFKLEVELKKAQDLGLLDIDPPFVEYDYKYYAPEDMKNSLDLAKQ